MADSPLTLSDHDRAALARRTRDVCVVFRNHPMPPGTTPPTARLGIESIADGALLHVDRGLAYNGADAEVRRWLVDGTRRFVSVPELLGWLDRVAGPRRETARRPAVDDRPSPDLRPALLAPADVTALDDVTVPEAGPTAPEAADLLDRLREQVVGQDDALTALAAAVAQHARKTFPRRPLSAMLIGPTGVGKTQTAETLARVLSDLGRTDWRVLRLDMTEFTERYAVSRLVGAPPGYIGYGDDSLATRLAAHPRHVVVFDEIDRAHPEVVTALMNLLDAGRLDSTRHGSVTATEAVLLFTSNLGAARLPAASALDADRAGRAHLLRHGMAPELVARFGVVTLFGPLDAPALAAVAARAVGVVAADYGVAVGHIDPAYLSRVLARVTGNGLGVRAIEHLVDAELGASLARHRGARVTVAADGEVTTDRSECSPADDAAPASPNPTGQPVERAG